MHRGMENLNVKADKQDVQQLPKDVGYGGQPWLVEERDACGVGFIAHQHGQASHNIIQKALIF